MDIVDACMDYAIDVSHFGLGCDTAASEKFHRLLELMKKDSELEVLAHEIEDIENGGSGRHLSGVLALLAASRHMSVQDLEKLAGKMIEHEERLK